MGVLVGSPSPRRQCRGPCSEALCLVLDTGCNQKYPRGPSGGPAGQSVCESRSRPPHPAGKEAAPPTCAPQHHSTTARGLHQSGPTTCSTREKLIGQLTGFGARFTLEKPILPTPPPSAVPHARPRRRTAAVSVGVGKWTRLLAKNGRQENDYSLIRSQNTIRQLTRAPPSTGTHAGQSKWHRAKSFLYSLSVFLQCWARARASGTASTRMGYTPSPIYVFFFPFCFDFFPFFTLVRYSGPRWCGSLLLTHPCTQLTL